MRDAQRGLAAALAFFALASLVHFTHNAEFIAEYPNMPASLTRGNVYLAWLAMTSVGVAGWLCVQRGWRAGLVVLAIYAALGLDSLGHYVLAPMGAHTTGMNVTILAEVTAAALVMLEVARLALRR